MTWGLQKSKSAHTTMLLPRDCCSLLLIAAKHHQKQFFDDFRPIWVLVNPIFIGWSPFFRGHPVFQVLLVNVTDFCHKIDKRYNYKQFDTRRILFVPSLPISHFIADRILTLQLQRVIEYICTFCTCTPTFEKVFYRCGASEGYS